MWSAAKPLLIPEQDGLLLRELVRSPSTPQGIAQRARIILLAGEGMANLAIARKLTIGRPTVLLWRERFKGQGTAGILKIEEGRGRKKEIKAEIVEAIIYDTLYTKPLDSTHWSTRTLAKKHHVSHDFIKKVWHAHNLKPHLVKTFKLSNRHGTTSLFAALNILKG